MTQALITFNNAGKTVKQIIQILAVLPYERKWEGRHNNELGLLMLEYQTINKYSLLFIYIAEYINIHLILTLPKV